MCDGFHAQYVARWGGDEAKPYPGPPVTDPRHFVRHQNKIGYLVSDDADTTEPTTPQHASTATTHLPIGEDGRAGVKRPRTPAA